MQQLVRALLRKHKDGLTLPEIEKALTLNYGASAISAELRNTMADAYIDRYKHNSTGGQLSAVWCVVDVPEHCPKPDKQRTKE